RLRPEGEGGAEVGQAEAGGEGSRHGASDRPRQPAAKPAVRRPAPAGRTGPRGGQRARGAAPRRAARRARPQAPAGDADRAEAEVPEPGMTVEPGQVEDVVYVGMTTRYIVRLDRGEQLVAVRQNMDAVGDAHKFQGRPVRLAWTANHTFVLDDGR